MMRRGRKRRRKRRKVQREELLLCGVMRGKESHVRDVEGVHVS